MAVGTEEQVQYDEWPEWELRAARDLLKLCQDQLPHGLLRDAVRHIVDGGRPSVALAWLEMMLQ